MNFQESTLQIEQFADMNLCSELLVSLEQSEIKIPTPIQSQAIPVALQGTDLIGIAQTGSGKTLAYGLSVMNHLLNNKEARALVLLPSRETAEQVYRVFNNFSTHTKLSVCLAATGVPSKELNSQLKKNPRIIIATPGRLVEQLKNNKLMLKNLKILVLDEADRMLDKIFEEQLKFIQSTLRGSWQTLMFAASFGNWAQPIAKIFMRPEAVLIRAKAAEKPVETLTQKVYFISQAQKERRLLDELKSLQGGVIVFADSHESCVAIGRLLAHHEFSSDFMHGDMNPGHRNRVLREFREEKIKILVTTDLLARGLDIPHVQHVISYELPYKSEDFLHRIGRTARAGRQGNAVTFVTPGDERTYRKMLPYLEGAEEKTLMTNFKFIKN